MVLFTKHSHPVAGVVGTVCWAYAIIVMMALISPMLSKLVLTSFNALSLYHCANAPGSTGEATVKVLGASGELTATPLKMQLPCRSMEDSAGSCHHA